MKIGGMFRWSKPMSLYYKYTFSRESNLLREYLIHLPKISLTTLNNTLNNLLNEYDSPYLEALSKTYKTIMETE